MSLVVVYGDIGTSPIFALRECLKAPSSGNAAGGKPGAVGMTGEALRLHDTQHRERP